MSSTTLRMFTYNLLVYILKCAQWQCVTSKCNAAMRSPEKWLLSVWMSWAAEEHIDLVPLYSSLYPQEFSGSRWQIKGEPFWIHTYVETLTLWTVRDASEGFKGKGNNVEKVCWLNRTATGFGYKQCHWKKETGELFSVFLVWLAEGNIRTEIQKASIQTEKNIPMSNGNACFSLTS